MPLDQSFESGFVALLSVAPEQLRIFIHHHSLYNIRRPENPTGNKFRRVFSVAAAILAAVESGILPPGKNAPLFGDLEMAGRFGVCVVLFRRAGCPALRQARRPPLRR